MNSDRTFYFYDFLELLGLDGEEHVRPLWYTDFWHHNNRHMMITFLPGTMRDFLRWDRLPAEERAYWDTVDAFWDELCVRLNRPGD